MIALQGQKIYVPQIGATVVTNATTVNTIDTLGFDYAAIDVIINPATAAGTSTFSALSLKEGDTTVVTSATAIAGFTGGTDLTIPASNDTTNPLIARLLVDLRPRKRYLFLSTTCPTNYNSLVVHVALDRPEQLPVTDAKRCVSTTTNVALTSVIG